MTNNNDQLNQVESVNAAKTIPLTSSSVPHDINQAKSGYFWDESTGVWMHPEYLYWLSLAGMTGVPGSCRRYFAKYVAWTADSSFIERDRSKPDWYKLISVMSCGEKAD